jgi:hypothetical protein
VPVSPAPSTLWDIGPGLGRNLQTPWFDATDSRFGAKGGATDDTAAIQATINAAGGAGGGRIILPLQHAVNTTGTALSALYVGADNITIEGTPNSKLTCGLIPQGTIGGWGFLKQGVPYDAKYWYEFQTVIPITAPSAGATSITASSAGNVSTLGLAAGDYICIRTGHLIGGTTQVNPDSELNQVSSVSGTTISLKWPLLKSYAQEYFPTPGTPTTLTADYHSGDTTITVASITGYSNGDYLTIGDAGGVMHMTQVLGTPSGSILPIRGSLVDGLTIASGAKVHKGTGTTTTNSTTAPAAFGLAKVTAVTIKNLTLRNLTIDQSISASSQFEQIDNLRIENCDFFTNGGAVVCNNVRNVWVVRNRVHHPIANADNYSIGFGRGSGVIHVKDNILTSELHCGLVASEGTVDFYFERNHIAKAAQGVSGRQTITVQSRSGKGTIFANHLIGGPTDYSVGIESNVGSLGGVIDHNRIECSSTNSIYVKSPSWTIGANNKVPAGSPVKSDSGAGILVPSPNVPLVLVKAADQSMNTQAVLQNDNDFVIPIGASATEQYFFEVYLHAVAANATMDIQVGWNFPTGVTILWGTMGVQAQWSNAAAAGQPNTLLAIGNVLTAGLAAAVDDAMFAWGWIFGGGTAGTLNFKWAQNTSDAGTLTVKKGSLMRITQVST